MRFNILSQSIPNVGEYVCPRNHDLTFHIFATSAVGFETSTLTRDLIQAAIRSDPDLKLGDVQGENFGEMVAGLKLSDLDMEVIFGREQNLEDVAGLVSHVPGLKEGEDDVEWSQVGADVLDECPWLVPWIIACAGEQEALLRQYLEGASGNSDESSVAASAEG